MGPTRMGPTTMGSTTMRQTTVRGRALASLGALAALTVVAVACSSSSEQGAATVGTPFQTNPPKTTPTTVKVNTATCAQKPLADALAKAKPEAKLGDYKCSSTFAVATVEGPGLAQFGEAGFFTVVDDGQWTFAKTVKVDDATLSSAPEGFPKAIYEEWLSAYRRPSRTSTTLCLYYDPQTQGCTDKPPAGYGPSTTAGV